MNALTIDRQIYTPVNRSESVQSIQLPIPSLSSLGDSLPSEDEFSYQQSPKSQASKNSRVTTIQEYTQLVIKAMKKHKRMNTTQVAKAILSSVHPKTSKLTVNIRRRVGDSLSVLTAINFVEKQSTGYVWKGGKSKPSERNSLLNEVEALKRKLELKKEQYRKLQEIELQCQRNLSLSKKSSLNIVTQPNPSYTKQEVDLDSCLDSSTTVALELDSPTHIHFNDYEEDIICPFPSFRESYSRFPSISFPQCTADEYSALTITN